jgi:hypothetical protein
MKGGAMTRIFPILLASLATALVAVLPATANSKPTTGTRIALGNPPATFAAGAPFYVEHGFACALGDAKCISEQISANGDFDLYIDGTLQPSRVDVDVRDGAISKLYLTNVAAGLPAGTHTFVGEWHLNGTVVQTRTATISFV